MIIPKINENKKRFWDNKWMETKKITATNHLLKPTQIKNSTVLINTIANGVKQKVDCKYFGRDIIIVGTELEQYRLMSYLMKQNGWQIKDSWDFKMETEFKNWYKENECNPYIINLNYWNL